MTKKIIMISTVIMLICSFQIIAHARVSEQEIDDFYNGLGDVIIGNMNSPSQCLAAAKEFYDRNAKLVNEIKKESALAMKKAQKYMDQNQIGQGYENSEISKYKSSQNNPVPDKLSPGIKKYTQALTDFTRRYPKEGIEIAQLAMRFSTFSGNAY